MADATTATAPSLADLKAAAKDITAARDGLNAMIAKARALGIQVTPGITYDTPAGPMLGQPGGLSIVTVSAVLPLTE